MREFKRLNWARVGLAAALLTGASFTGGCVFTDDSGVRPSRLAAVSPAPRKRAKVARLVKARTVVHGASLRQFCDRRHVEFQSGKLHEQPAEMAHGDRGFGI